jgi:hypothetical protein
MNMTQILRKKISTKEELVEVFKSLNLDFEEGKYSIKVRGEAIFVTTEIIPSVYVQQNNIRLGFEKSSEGKTLIILEYPDIYTERKTYIDLDNRVSVHFDKPFMIFNFPIEDKE